MGVERSIHLEGLTVEQILKALEELVKVGHLLKPDRSAIGLLGCKDTSFRVLYLCVTRIRIHVCASYLDCLKWNKLIQWENLPTDFFRSISTICLFLKMFIWVLFVFVLWLDQFMY